MESKYNIRAENNIAPSSQFVDLTADSAEETDEELPYGTSNEPSDTSKMAALIRENRELRLKVARLEENSRHGQRDKEQHSRRNEQRSRESRKRIHSRERNENPKCRPHASKFIGPIQSKQSNEINPESGGERNSDQGDSDQGNSDQRNPDQRNRPTNTDKSRYFNSKSAKICHLCDKTYTKLIVSHYKKEHPESEVFVSRLSQKMVDEILSEKIVSIYEDQKGFPEPVVGGRCYFCDSVKRFQMHYWQQHYTTHTGEYMYECCICNRMVSSKKHCDFAAKRIIPSINLRHYDLCGYLCLDCNFVQLDEDNMKNHQQNEHKHSEKLNERYRKIILLPSRQRMNSNNSNEGKQFTSKENNNR